MRKRKTENRGDLQYKCRRCGVLFSPRKGKLEIPFSIYLEQTFWTPEERKREMGKISHLVGLENIPPPDLPDMFSYHECNKGELGLSDFVGFVNIMRMELFKNQWRAIE